MTGPRPLFFRTEADARLAQQTLSERGLGAVLFFDRRREEDGMPWGVKGFDPDALRVCPICKTVDPGCRCTRRSPDKQAEILLRLAGLRPEQLFAAISLICGAAGKRVQDPWPVQPQRGRRGKRRKKKPELADG